MIDYTKFITDGEKIESDCTVISSDGVEFGVHTHILERIEFFQAMFDSTMIEGIIKVATMQEDQRILTILFNYIYTSTLDTVKAEDYLELFTITDKYRLDDLRRLIVKNIASTLTVETAIEMLHFGDTHPISDLSNAVLEFISKNLIVLKESTEYKEADEELKKRIVDGCAILKMMRDYSNEKLIPPK